MVVLPDHLHAIWRLPEGDSGDPMRWSLIKARFSRRLPKFEPIGASRARGRERGIGQRRYWEHPIRDDDDLARHVHYLHFNPVGHGYVERAIGWPNFSIHRFVRAGAMCETWGVR